LQLFFRDKNKNVFERNNSVSMITRPIDLPKQKPSEEGFCKISKYESIS
jgi:hypothetical protein